MRNILTIFFLIIVIISCTNHKYDKQMPTDFSFKITNTIDSYDSKTGIYIRTYIKNDSVVKAALTPKEMNIIYELFKKNDFLSFPDNFECSKFATTRMPAFETTIEITYKGLHKRVTNSDFCDKKTEQRKSDKFNEFGFKINMIIKNKTEIKNMRECNMIFM